MKYNNLLWAVILFTGMFMAVFVPWYQMYTVHPRLSWAMPTDSMRLVYAYGRTIFYDVTQFPFHVFLTGTGGALIRLGSAMIGLLLGVVVLSPVYRLLLLGFVGPALFGLPMPAYRLLPFYPFLFVGASRELWLWMASTSSYKRAAAVTALLVFIVCNMSAWVRTTIYHPRNDYGRALVVTSEIERYVRSRSLSGNQIGVHYVTPLDGNDYEAPPYYYLLRTKIDYSVTYTSAGNELRRNIDETRPTVFLVCDGFVVGDDAIGCTQPLLKRFPWYVPVRKLFVSANTTIVVLEKKHDKNP